MSYKKNGRSIFSPKKNEKVIELQENPTTGSSQEHLGPISGAERKIQAILDEHAQIIFLPKECEKVHRIRKALGEQLRVWCEECEERAMNYKSKSKKLQEEFYIQKELVEQITTIKASIQEKERAQEITDLKTLIAEVSKEISELERKLSILYDHRSHLVKRLQTCDSLEQTEIHDLEDQLLRLQEQYDARPHVNKITRTIYALREKESFLRFMVSQANSGIQFYQRFVEEVHPSEMKLQSLSPSTATSKADLPISEAERSEIATLLSSILHSFKSALEVAISNNWKPIIILLEQDIVLYEERMNSFSSMTPSDTSLEIASQK
ncbi:Schizosaccharomyces specific protein [Schizosaccharomyces osmophilus]|uniref:Schizosaccharomyces specific protein n=1 Tax=Schizosaccharomyces osmophilus TaxID=2545709 RepID=A0AAF0AUU5_9SCHI|nr:Schizosaccharomyces specific protein [Schizosaccharomyces osmophilus]WBW71972.1 Schizosaccharomyces specific protein [Schizosaccharomyces osmophilus]